MRSPILHGVRPLADYEVDRPEVYARQRVQPTGTNRPRTWLLLALAIGFRARSSKSGPGLASSRISRVTGDAGIGDSGRTRGTVSVAMAEGKHPVPFRTRKLSPPARLGRAERAGPVPWIRGGARPGRAWRAIRSGAAESVRPEGRCHPEVH